MGGGGNIFTKLFGGSTANQPVYTPAPSPVVTEPAPVENKQAKKKRRPKTVLTGMSGDLSTTGVLKQKLGQ